MGKLLARVPKNLLSIGSLTGCFTLIAVGCGMIGGLGVGLMIGGVLGVVAHTVAHS
jgi:hypothetical protein